jgi:hypothetical protein
LWLFVHTNLEVIDGGPPRWVRILAAVTMAATLSMQPVFLLGA